MNQWEMRPKTYTITRDEPTCLRCGERIDHQSATSVLTGAAKCGCDEAWVGRVTPFSGSMKWDTIRQLEPGEDIDKALFSFTPAAP